MLRRVAVALTIGQARRSGTLIAPPDVRSRVSSRPTPCCARTLRSGLPARSPTSRVSSSAGPMWYGQGAELFIVKADAGRRLGVPNDRQTIVIRSPREASGYVASHANGAVRKITTSGSPSLIENPLTRSAHSTSAKAYSMTTRNGSLTPANSSVRRLIKKASTKWTPRYSKCSHRPFASCGS